MRKFRRDKQACDRAVGQRGQSSTVVGGLGVLWMVTCSACMMTRQAF